jgi:cytochrome c biogenesis factor
MMDTKAVSLYKNISILILTLMSPCLLVDEVTASMGSPFIYRSAIMFNLLILALLSLQSSKKWNFSKDQKTILIYFVLAIGYYFILSKT